MTEFLGMPTSRPRPVADLDTRAAGLRSGREPYVMATVVRAQRPTSAKAGDRALVLADGTIEGFVGGVCATDTVRAQGLRLMGTGAATLLRITPEEDAQREEEGLVAVGQPCLSGGTLEIFLESVSPPRLVRVHGDSPIARAFAEVGRAMGYTVEPGTGPVATGTAAVLVASHGVGEEPVLREALAAGVPYVGLIASRRRGAAVLARVEGGERVHVPAGLDIGARTPGEVAVSVYAEIIRLR
ncbi:xanthine dehydrogenase accessory factor [Nonomuraea thailandensis]|uniref:Xanthine dehydrogenase accessory factor n=1 Tax=Nonomuraea thailandensis TaxID=1188745 RepID=A0A9X2GJS9_9ACTN|nr:XdhC family protein [Nonomuraea thailandensis]MCP2359060.1 xanthine dehydrogenase accessory factor [Nonomuraea thailandensis]